MLLYLIKIISKVQTTTTYLLDNWGFFVKKSGRFNFYHRLTFYMSFDQILILFSKYQGFNHFRKKIRRSRKKSFFAKDKCELLKLPGKIDIFHRIGHFYETPIFLSVPYIPLVKWIYFDPCYSSLQNFYDGY